MTQDEYDNITAILTNGLHADELKAFKKLWKKFQQYQGAVIFGKVPEIHVHYDDRKQA